MSSDVADLESPPAAQPTVTDPVVRADSLTVEFSGQKALDGVTFAIPAGLIVGLIGPSGCGKTTLVRTMTGIISPTSGTMEVFGQDPRTFTTRQRTRFGYMPQQPTLFPNLTVWANLNFVASLYGMPVTRRRRRLMRLLDLVDLLPAPLEEAGGLLRRHAATADARGDTRARAGAALSRRADRPASTRSFASDSGSTSAASRDQGKTIVVPTQYVGEAVSCDAVAVIAHGRLLTVQPPDQLARVAYDGDADEHQLRRLGAACRARAPQALPHVRSVQHSDAGLTVVLQDQASAEPLHQHLSETGVNVSLDQAAGADLRRHLREAHRAATATQGAPAA